MCLVLFTSWSFLVENKSSFCLMNVFRNETEQNKKVTNLNVNVCFEMHKLMLNMLCFCLLFEINYYSIV